METKELGRMIERFFDAELTVDEERELCRYLRDNDVPAELRKDKEAIITLCSDIEADDVLPHGTTERLEAMLDGLDQQQKLETDNTANAVEKKEKIFKIPRYIASSTVAAAIIVMAYIAIPYGHRFNSNADVVAVINEEDTFDNPEDAMRCLKMAFGDMQYATAIAHSNTKKIGAILELSATMCNKQ